MRWKGAYIKMLHIEISVEKINTEDIQHACKVITHALQTDNDFYDAFVASIESALRESTIVWEEWEYTETAKKIADRLIGK